MENFPCALPRFVFLFRSMHGIAAHTLADRFAWLFDGLCKAIGVDAHKRRMEAALAWAIWNRVRALGDRSGMTGSKRPASAPSTTGL